MIRWSQMIAPADPKDFKMTEAQWAEGKKKDGVTAVELAEAVRRNGIWHCWDDEIYVSSRTPL